MNQRARTVALADFCDADGPAQVLLLSLHASSVGLNLTAANHVILLDPWWNPTIEEQAIDRTHRIGQTKTVHVTRILTRDTIEGRILELQAAKRTLVRGLFSKGGGGNGGGNLSARDLGFLFENL